MLAPRIVNDVSYARGFKHEIHFAWQAQCLVRCDLMSDGSFHVSGLAVRVNCAVQRIAA